MVTILVIVIFRTKCTKTRSYWWNEINIIYRTFYKYWKVIKMSLKAFELVPAVERLKLLGDKTKTSVRKHHPFVHCSYRLCNEVLAYHKCHESNVLFATFMLFKPSSAKLYIEATFSVGYPENGTHTTSFQYESTFLFWKNLSKRHHSLP